MYELDEHDREVADQIDSLPPRAWADDEAAITFILHQPFDGDVFNRRAVGDARVRSFGLDRGKILYTPDSTNRRVHLDRVSLLR